jgi:hypothetical protein
MHSLVEWKVRSSAPSPRDQARGSYEKMGWTKQFWGEDAFPFDAGNVQMLKRLDEAARANGWG